MSELTPGQRERRPLTAKQELALRDARFQTARGVGPWDYGSTTIARLKREGLIVRTGDRYTLTELGRETLELLENA